MRRGEFSKRQRSNHIVQELKFIKLIKQYCCYQSVSVPQAFGFCFCFLHVTDQVRRVQQTRMKICVMLLEARGEF